MSCSEELSSPYHGRGGDWRKNSGNDLSKRENRGSHPAQQGDRYVKSSYYGHVKIWQYCTCGRCNVRYMKEHYRSQYPIERDAKVQEQEYYDIISYDDVDDNYIDDIILEDDINDAWEDFLIYDDVEYLPCDEDDTFLCNHYHSLVGQSSL